MNHGLIDTSALPALYLLRKVLRRKVKALINFDITITFNDGSRHEFPMLFRCASDAIKYASCVYGAQNKIEVTPA